MFKNVIVATYVVAWMTSNYGTLDMLQGVAVMSAEVFMALAIVGIFVFLPIATGSLAKAHLVAWVDHKFDSNVSFAWWQHLLIGGTMALVIGAWYPFLSGIAMQNAQILWVLQLVSPVQETVLNPLINLLATGRWFWFGAGVFMITYLVTKYKN